MGVAIGDVVVPLLGSATRRHRRDVASMLVAAHASSTVVKRKRTSLLDCDGIDTVQ